MKKLYFDNINGNFWGCTVLKDFRKGFPEHFHDYYTFGSLFEGVHEVNIKGVKRIIYENELIVFNPDEIHGCKPMNENKSSWINIIISKPLMKMIFNSPAIYPCFQNWPDKNMKIDLIQFSERLCNVSLSKKLALIREFAERLPKKNPESANKAPEKQAQILLNYIEDLFSKHSGIIPSLEIFCRQTGEGKFRFLRNFHKYAGITPYRYYEAKRIEYAAFLIAQGESLLHSAMRAGFYDQSHLCRHFTRYFGYSPGIYLKALKNMKIFRTTEVNCSKKEKLS